MMTTMSNDKWDKAWERELLRFINKRLEELDEYSKIMRYLERTGKL